ncbi:chromosome partitioning protein [Nocardioides oleivorans]|uniref:Chromosome partitioning protein n=1 Tax=Nocardioides oleivorans TaxID=273676 RepID=A0A4Q2S0R1_9ACTN|nr:chromosome partitioning protein [Nocardioides oleivorans]RYB95097.1 chromosome partitioning protein [Nocardioides oleivorans]
MSSVGADAVICVLVLAAGEAWESPALADLEAHPGVVVLKRCVDVDDLLASVTSGQADVAVVSLDAPGLDPASIAHLRRHAVRPVAVTSARSSDLDVDEHAQRLGITALVGAGELASLPEVVTTVKDVADTRARAASPVPALPGADRGTGHDADDESDEGATGGRLVVVWGPAGAPGRTTVATNLAAEVARRGTDVVLADLDPYGGAVAQQLGILDEVSGLLSASRLAASGQLDARFASVCRGVGDHLAVVTGLPRADRWREVRAAQVDQLLDGARGWGDVVVDTGFSLEDDAASDFGGRPGRNSLTLTALDRADELVVVGSADPVGLARLARGLVELRERGTAAPVRVVVNRMRSSIGWSEKEIAGMVEGFSRVSGLHFLPEDRSGVDRAVVAGLPLAEVGDSSLVRGLAALADAVFPASVAAGAGHRRVGRRVGLGAARWGRRGAGSARM